MAAVEAKYDAGGAVEATAVVAVVVSAEADVVVAAAAAADAAEDLKDGFANDA